MIEHKYIIDKIYGIVNKSQAEEHNNMLTLHSKYAAVCMIGLYNLNKIQPMPSSRQNLHVY